MTNPSHRTIESPRNATGTDAAHNAESLDDDTVTGRGPDVESVPAGGRGADSGAAEAVYIEPGDTAEVPDRSRGNDAPGVGTRGAGDSERVETPGTRSIEQGEDDMIPDMHDDREDPRVERSLKQRLRRDAGPDAARAAVDPDLQTRPKMAQHVASVDDVMWGILLQTRADLPNADRRRLREVYQERLCQAGIDLPADEVDRFLQRQPADRHEY
jgi:hypothetical protein